MNGRKYSVLLAGLGGDSHSVGISILRAGLSSHGYVLRFLGAQNSLDDIMSNAHHFNVVLISNMDGHARYYLQAFPEMRKAPKLGQTLFYLGGNIATNNRERTKRDFLEMGFQRVFLSFVSVEEVVALLERDLHGAQVKHGHFEPLAGDLRHHPVPLNQRLELDVFSHERKQVLAQWHTGQACTDLAESAEFLLQTPNFAQAHHQQQNPIAHLRVGVPNLKEQLRYLDLVKRGGVRVLSHQVDSLTRLSQFTEADAALKHHSGSKASFLNGLPMVNHGVSALRQITRELGLPLQTRHSARDPRLLAEISYAAGMTGFEGGPIGYNLPYYRDYRPAEALEKWRYVERLTGLYFERYGVVLDREFFGPLTGTLIPPCIAITCVLLEMLFAAKQGVRSFSLGLGETGHRWQDVAGLKVLKSKAEQLLKEHVGNCLPIHLVFHQYMAAFPRQPERARELIYESAMTAALGRADRLIVKTPVEAFRIPRISDNLEALQIVERGFKHASLLIPDQQTIDREAQQIANEVDDLLHAVFEVGHADLSQGIVEAIRQGIIDVPFAPSIHSLAKVLTARDNSGAVRFSRIGNLPFRKETRQFHEDKISERRRSFGLLNPKDDFQMTQFDAIQIPSHDYEQWPLNGKSPIPN
jgi:methylaspartate mutase epsilon subunit